MWLFKGTQPQDFNLCISGPGELFEKKIQKAKISCQGSFMLE
jgi:hypothetical protein